MLISITMSDMAQNNSSDSKKDVKYIKINRAKRLVFDKTTGNEAQRLIGEVECEHEGAIMRCDSAYLYSQKRLDAFGNITIIKGDSIFVYGDSLRYEATTKIARLKGNVRCVEKDMTLTTSILDYDVANGIASYYNGGTIVNKENTLKSKNGHYYSATKELFFHYNVSLVNPDYKITSDTLRYNTSSKVTYFIGPSNISSKENHIYCENGWYDTNKEISRFSKKAIITTKEQKMTGDSLYYDRKSGYGKATKNVMIIDTANKSIITGNFAEHYQKNNRALVKDNAIFGKIIDKDTLFLSAENLSYTQPDSVHTYVKALGYAKLFKKDLQGLCDSITYAMHDSLMLMHNSPVLWTNSGQVTAKQIKITTGKNSVKSFLLEEDALLIHQVDSLDKFKFDQITGKKIEGFIEKDTVRKVSVISNSHIIYYMKEKKSYKGVNQTTCTDVNIWFKNGEIYKATFKEKPESTLFPMKEVNDEEMRLKNFVWLEHKRPKKKSDILIRP